MSGGQFNGHYSASGGYKTDHRSEAEFQSTSQERTHHGDHDEIRKQQSRTINLEELKSRETTRIATADDVRALLEAEFKGIAEIQTSREISVEEFNYIESQFRKSHGEKVDSQTKYSEEHRLENILENPEWKKHYGVPILNKNEVIDVKEMTVVEKNYQETIPSSTLNVPQSRSATISSSESAAKSQNLQGSNPQITVTTMEHPEGYGSLRHELKQKRHVLEEVFVEEKETFYEKTTPKKAKRISAEIEKSRSTGELVQQNQPTTAVSQTHSETTSTVVSGTYPRSSNKNEQAITEHDKQAASIPRSPKKKSPQSELVVEDTNLFTDETKRNSWFTSDIKIKPLFPNKYKHYVVNKAVSEHLGEDKPDKNLVASHAAETRVSNLSLGESKKPQKEIVVSDVETFKDGKLDVEHHDYSAMAKKSDDEVKLRPMKHKLEDTETKLRPKSKIHQEEMVLDDMTVYEDKQFKSLKKPKKKFFNFPKTKTMPPKFKVKEKFKIKKSDNIENEVAQEVDREKKIQVIKPTDGADQLVLEDTNVFKETTTIKSKDKYSSVTLEKQKQILSDIDKEVDLNSRGAYTLTKSRSSQQEIVIDDPNIFRETTLTRKHKEKPSKHTNKILNDIMSDVSNLNNVTEKQKIDVTVGQTQKATINLQNDEIHRGKADIKLNQDDLVYDYKHPEPETFNVSLEYKNKMNLPQQEIIVNGESNWEDSTRLKLTLDKPKVDISTSAGQPQLVESDRAVLEQGELILEDSTLYEDKNKPKKIILEHGKVMNLAEIDDTNLPVEVHDEIDAKTGKEKLQPSKKKKRLKLKFGRKNQGESVKDKSFVYEDATKIRFPTLTKKEKGEVVVESKAKIEKDVNEQNPEEKPFWNWNFDSRQKPQEEVVRDETHYHEDVSYVNEAAIDVPSDHETQKTVESSGDKLGKIKIKFPSLPRPNISFGSKKTQDEIVVNEQNLVKDDTNLIVNLDVKDSIDSKEKSLELKQKSEEAPDENVDVSTQATQTSPQVSDEITDEKHKFKITLPNIHIPKPSFHHESKSSQEEQVIHENISPENEAIDKYEVVDENKKFKINLPSFHIPKPHLNLGTSDSQGEVIIDKDKTAVTETSDQTKDESKPIITQEVDQHSEEHKFKIHFPHINIKKPDIHTEPKKTEDEGKPEQTSAECVNVEKDEKVTEEKSTGEKEHGFKIHLPNIHFKKSDLEFGSKGGEKNRTEEIEVVENITEDDVSKEKAKIEMGKKTAETQEDKTKQNQFEIKLPQLDIKKPDVNLSLTKTEDENKVVLEEKSQKPDIVMENDQGITEEVKVNEKESKFKIHLPNIHFKKPDFRFGSKSDTKEQPEEKKFDEKVTTEKSEVPTEEQIPPGKESKFKIHLPHINFKRPNFNFGSKSDPKETKEKVKESDSKQQEQVIRGNETVTEVLTDSTETKLEVKLPHVDIKKPDLSLDISKKKESVEPVADTIKITEGAQKEVIVEETSVTKEEIGKENRDEQLSINLPQVNIKKPDISFKTVEKDSKETELNLTEEVVEEKLDEKESKFKIHLPNINIPKPHLSLGFSEKQGEIVNEHNIVVDDTRIALPTKKLDEIKLDGKVETDENKFDVQLPDIHFKRPNLNIGLKEKEDDKVVELNKKSFEEILVVDKETVKEPQNETVKQEEVVQEKSKLKIEQVPEEKSPNQEIVKEDKEIVEESKKSKSKFKLPNFHFPNFKIGFKSNERKTIEDNTKTSTKVTKDVEIEEDKTEERDKKGKFKLNLPHLGVKSSQNEIVVGDIPVIPDDSKVVVELKKSRSGLIEDVDKAIEEEVAKIENEAKEKTLERVDKVKSDEADKHTAILPDVHMPQISAEHKQEEIIVQPDIVTDSTKIVIKSKVPETVVDVEKIEKSETNIEKPSYVEGKFDHIEITPKEPQQEIVVDESHVVTDQTQMVICPSKPVTDVDKEAKPKDHEGEKIVEESLKDETQTKPQGKTDINATNVEIAKEVIEAEKKPEAEKNIPVLSDSPDFLHSKPQEEVVVESTDVITEKTTLDVSEEHVVSDGEHEEGDSKKEKVKILKGKLRFPKFGLSRSPKKAPATKSEKVDVVDEEIVSVDDSTLKKQETESKQESVTGKVELGEIGEKERKEPSEKTDSSKTSTLEGKKEKKKYQSPFSKIHFGKKSNQKEVVINDGHIYTDNSTLGKKKKSNLQPPASHVYIVENDLPESKECKIVPSEDEKIKEGDEKVVEHIAEAEIVEKETAQKKEKVHEITPDQLTDSGKPKKSSKILNIFNRSSGEYDLEHPSKTNQPLVELISSKPKAGTSSTDDVSGSKPELHSAVSSKHQSNLTLDSTNKPTFESEEHKSDSSKSVENVQIYQPSPSSSTKQIHLDSQGEEISQTQLNLPPTSPPIDASTPIKSTDQTETAPTTDKPDLTTQPSPEDQDEEAQKNQLNWVGSTGRNTSYFSTVSRVTTCHDERTPLQFVVVAIDFGTTFSGYAFSFTKDVDSIHVMRKWEGGDPGVTNQKTPTILLLTPEKEFHSFGFTARDFYHDLSQKEAKKWLYFEKFKMALHYNADLTSDTEIQAANGVPMKALDVFAHALRFFRNHALLEISEQSNTPLHEDDIRWVITVPAIWKAPAKQFMREAAYKANIASSEKSDRLVIALEPEAASVFVRRQRLKQLIPEVIDELKDARTPTTATTSGLSDTLAASTSASEANRNASPVLLDTIAYQTRLADESGSWSQSLTSNAMSMSFQRCPSPTSFPVSVGHEIDITDNRFMVADCGGGTVDITVYEMLSATGGSLREIYKASGGPYGSMGVDIEFERLLTSIFGGDFIDAFKLKRPAGWVDLMMAFESRKRAANPFKTKALNVSLPFSFIDYHKKFRNSTVESAVRKHNSKDVKWSSQGMLRLMPEAMNALFQPTLDNITASIANVINQPEVSGVRHIFLVGGFSESPMLQQEVRKNFDDKARILIPNDVSLAILKGAVLYGIDPSVVVIRKSRLTYGLGVLNRFVEGKHPESKKAMKDGTPWCVDVFDPLVLADQSVTLGSSVIRSYTPASVDQKFSLFHIYCSEDRHVEYVSDEGVAKCGTLRLDLDDHQWDLESNPSRPASQHISTNQEGEMSAGVVELPRGRREVQARLTFGDTEIKIVALDVATGNYVRATLDFLNK